MIMCCTLNCMLMRVPGEAWCVCEQTRKSKVDTFNLLSFSSDQTLATTRTVTCKHTSLIFTSLRWNDKNLHQLLLAESLKAALLSFQELEKLILRCSVRKVQVTMAATVWAALPPGVSSWLHGSDGRLSHSSGSPRNLVWGNVALRQQTALSKAYQGHTQKRGV